jgi:hypothetical protein
LVRAFFGDFYTYFQQTQVKGALEMDLNKAELSVIEAVAAKATEQQLRELDELQLTMIGGGIGETVLA